MNTLTPTRQQIIEVIDNLPEDAFSELVSFIGYLRYKAVETKTAQPHNSFLLSINMIYPQIIIFWFFNR